tara:strand:+ start:257 stop:1435 length:1179 start_codon:yes stop_codon:yes gene_type:complete
VNTPTYTILIHYSEIALKKNNRSFFEKIFINNIKKHLKNLSFSNIKLSAARVFINNVDWNKWEDYSRRLNNVMGLKNATLMMEVDTNLESLKLASIDLVKEKKFINFRITTKRHHKQLKFNSQDANLLIGACVQKETNKPVNLNNPDLNIIIELLKNKSYIGFEKINGYSGLPAHCQEKAISLISSGIDSPVASFEMIKRGVNLSYIHFHSFPAVNQQSIDNVKIILEILTKYQLKSTLFLVPLLEIQQQIMAVIPDKYWVIFFRKYMVKIANNIANKIGAVALITGDSIGQVASQTLSNIRAIQESSELPIIRPLSGSNKEEIINKAKNIGTYNISIEPYEDCCSFFVPPHPETKAKLNQVHALENSLELDKVYKQTIDKIEQIEFEYLGD